MAAILPEATDGLMNHLDCFGQEISQIAMAVKCQSVSEFKEVIVKGLKQYLKDKTFAYASVGSEASSLKLHAASLPHDSSERGSLINMADFAESLLDGGKKEGYINLIIDG